MIEIVYNHTVSSTNDLAMENDSLWSFYIAEIQTKGRGQRGNSWESEEGKNLTFSFAMSPIFIQPQRQFYISKIVSLAIAYTLEDLEIEPKIKWPNDIYVDSKKICGILIENVISSRAEIIKSVVGIGLNINQREFLSDAPNPISISLLKGGEFNRNEILNNFALHITKLYSLLENEELSYIDNQYIKYLYRYNKFSQFSDKNGEFTGKICSVRPQGELIIEDREGRKRSYLFKEVEHLLP